MPVQQAPSGSIARTGRSGSWRRNPFSGAAAAAVGLLQKVFAKLEAGDPGLPQVGGEYQREFEPDYAVVDLSQPAIEVHRQVRAWSFMPERIRRGPVLDGRRLVRTSITEVDGAEQIDCGDGPLWVLEAVPA